jgi:hypothetical protein
MTAINFPSSPTDQQLYTDATGNQFVYYSTPGVWRNSKPIAFTRYFALNQPGYVAGAMTGQSRFYPAENITITQISASVSEAVTNATVQFKLFKNGSDTGSTYTINIGDTQLSATNVTISLTTTDYLTLNMVAGTAFDLRVNFKYITS